MAWRDRLRRAVRGPGLLAGAAGRHGAGLPLALALGLDVLVVLLTPCTLMNDTAWYLSQTFHFPGPRPCDFYSLCQPAAAWEVTYPPGLPLLWDVFLALFGRHWIAAFLLFQHAARIAAVWTLWKMGQEAGRPAVGWWAALAYALHVPSALYSQSLLSEPTFTLLVVLAVRSLARGFATWTHAGTGSSLRDSWFGGVFLAASVLVRFSPFALLGAAGAAVMVVLARPRGERSGRRAATAGAVLRPILVPAAAVMLFIPLWNGIVFSRWGYGTHVGRHLFDRAFCMGTVAAPGDPAYEALLAYGRPVAAEDGDGTPSRTLRGVYWYQIYPLLRATGMSLDEADRLMGKAARAAILRMPGRWLRTLIEDVLNPERGRLLSRDEFIPEHSWRQGRRPPPHRDPYVVPGLNVGPPAEAATRRMLLALYCVPDAPPVPERLRQPLLDLLQCLPEWNGLWIWFVLAGSVLACRRPAAAASETLCAYVFWAAILFQVAVHGPLPRYYTALLPLALWVGMNTIVRRRPDDPAGIRPRFGRDSA
jgi:hypothetical protein